jgi:DNA-binding FrmR family transcriptional regulator
MTTRQDFLTTCGCGSAEIKGRKAVAVDPEIKSNNLKRLRRIEGQVRGIHKMVDGERYCADILIQVSAVQEALRAVSRALMKNHLRHCAAETFAKGTKREVEQMYEELLHLMDKHS